MVIANTVHPSIGRPLRWVVIGATAGAEPVSDAFGSEAERVKDVSHARADAIVLDWMAASHLAPGIKPRPYAIVVRAREERPRGVPEFIVVTASYPSQKSARPLGLEMARSEGQLVGDAIVVARSMGVVLDTVMVEHAFFENIARNEQIELGGAAREFLAAAIAALKPTTAT